MYATSLHAQPLQHIPEHMLQQLKFIVQQYTFDACTRTRGQNGSLSGSYPGRDAFELVGSQHASISAATHRSRWYALHVFIKTKQLLLNEGRKRCQHNEPSDFGYVSNGRISRLGRRRHKRAKNIANMFRMLMQPMYSITSAGARDTA